jgi:hypothetical protein
MTNVEYFGLGHSGMFSILWAPLCLSVTSSEAWIQSRNLPFCFRIRKTCNIVTLSCSWIPHLATLEEVVVWAVATLEVWVVADLAVVREVEASEVVRRQCFNLIRMLVVHCSCTSVMKYSVYLTFIVHSCRSVFLYVGSKLVGSGSSLMALHEEVVWVSICTCQQEVPEGCGFSWWWAVVVHRVCCAAHC